jgi:hypothetical protein
MLGGTPMRWILNRFTYANVMATFAVFLGLTGTAVAAVAVANNSVGSPQIINGSIQSVDIGNGQVTGADVAEGTLAKVPSAVNADKLGGIAAKNYPRLDGNFVGTFDSNNLVYPANRGTYGLYCSTAGPKFYYDTTALGANSRTFLELNYSDGPYGTEVTKVFNNVGTGGGTAAFTDVNFHVTASATSANGTKAVRLEAWGYGKDDSDVNTTGDCWGSIQAYIIK